MNLPSFAPNTVLGGPTSGSAPAPGAARLLVPGDLPISAGSGIAISSGQISVGNPMTSRVAGNYYTKDFSGAIAAGTITLGTLYVFFFEIEGTESFDRIACAVTAVASSFMRLVAYEDDNGKPSSLLIDSGQISGATLGVKEATISLSRGRGLWIGGGAQGVAASPTRFPAHNDRRVGNTSPYSQGQAFAYSQTGFTGAPPDPWGATLTPVGAANTVPLVYLRKA